MRAWSNLDQAVSNPSVGFYAAPGMPGHRAVRHDLDTLKSYVEVVKELSPRRLALGIGLSRGATHFLWTRLFDEVIAVDRNYWMCCKAAVEFSDSHSTVVYGDSREAVTIQEVRRALAGRQVDHLFVDADPAYDAVLSDFVSYVPFLRPDGLVGFGGPSRAAGDVEAFLADLGRGRVPGWPPVDVHAFPGAGDQITGGIPFLYKRAVGNE